MNDMIQLAVYVGKLEARLEAMEKQLSARETVPIRLDMGGHDAPDSAEPDDDLASKRLQDGIDSILGYQWPPRKDGRE